VLAPLLLVSAGVVFVSARLGSIGREWVIEALEKKFDSDLELGNLTISLFPRMHASGENLVFRHKGRTDVPPLIAIKKFSADTGVLNLLRSPRRVSQVRLEGLEIHVPPKRDQAQNGDSKQQRANKADRGGKPPFLIEEIVADGTTLRLLPKDSWKTPLLFDIQKLTLHSVGTDRPMNFRAVLMNAKPPGLIHSTGTFGPWQSEDPGRTHVAGSYNFSKADLSVFRGIAGILSSVGKYDGVLERIEVRGTTDTPDFTVQVSGNPVHLKTEFHAIVDGTNGDTQLQPVRAQFLNSVIIAKGAVAGTPGVKGKTVSLDLTVSDARLEDLLRLAVKSGKAPLSGQIRFTTKFLLPPGDQDIADKLKLDGKFAIDDSRFNSLNVQQKVEALSRRGRGEPEETDGGSVVSDFAGRFSLDAGVMRFSNLSFSTPGAEVHLNGTYGLRPETLNFAGRLELDAKLSETTTGVKSFLLRAVDPLFRRDGKRGSSLPIKITGSRQEPAFGLDIGRAARFQK
jgi:AsmA-like C-terminal region